MTGGKGCAICNVAGGLVIIGALNWGAIGMFNVDLVAQLFGGPSAGGARALYALVGVAGVLKLLSCFKLCPCQKQGCETKK